MWRFGDGPQTSSAGRLPPDMLAALLPPLPFSSPDSKGMPDKLLEWSLLDESLSDEDDLLEDELSSELLEDEDE